MSLASGYHPQSEHANQEVVRCTALIIRKIGQNSFQYAQNYLHHSSMNLTPFQGMLSYQPPLYFWNATPTEVPSVDG